MFLGIGERKTKTLTALAPSTAFEVVAPPERKYFGEDWRDLPCLPSVPSSNVDLDWKLRRIRPTASA